MRYRQAAWGSETFRTCWFDALLPPIRDTARPAMTARSASSTARRAFGRSRKLCTRRLSASGPQERRAPDLVDARQGMRSQPRRGRWRLQSDLKPEATGDQRLPSPSRYKQKRLVGADVADLPATRTRRRLDYVALLVPTGPATPRISTRDAIS